MKRNINIVALRNCIRKLSSEGYTEYKYENEIMVFWRIK